MKEIDHRAERVGLVAGTHAHGRILATAKRLGEAFLDDHEAIQTVPGQIGDPEPPVVEELFDHVLATQQLGPGLQVILERVIEHIALCQL